ncbi:hypothetical protein CDAR_468951 [Caerostris darwini]|uniref:Uncharacterized protein n=1 Tax=Caerostris darwini TaxID=1538125 RepID=A0AAV4R3C4_9ARAC|nr:hypothetical protein CDAR_468951 [Caerostris darwini]
MDRSADESRTRTTRSLNVEQMVPGKRRVYQSEGSQSTAHLFVGAFCRPRIYSATPTLRHEIKGERI